VILTYILLTVLFAAGAWLICGSVLWHDRSFAGASALRHYGKWNAEQKDFWVSPLMQKLTGFAGRFVFLDATSEEALARQLSRGGVALTPRQFTARKYVILAAGALGAVFCVLLQFWLGIILCALLAMFGMMRQRDVLQSKMKERDEAISLEMPRFIRTICRNLIGNRDIYAALQSYRKVSGPVLGAELDILLAHMRSGNTASALQQFQSRIGTEEAFRFCSALIEIERGIDQTATLDYLADDMARQAKLRVQKQLSTRPGKMRRTYYPAVGVCVAMILYVLVIFVIDQLNSII